SPSVLLLLLSPPPPSLFPPLSLHDALPISGPERGHRHALPVGRVERPQRVADDREALRPVRRLLQVPPHIAGRPAQVHVGERFGPRDEPPHDRVRQGQHVPQAPVRVHRGYAAAGAAAAHAPAGRRLSRGAWPSPTFLVCLRTLDTPSVASPATPRVLGPRAATTKSAGRSVSPPGVASRTPGTRSREPVSPITAALRIRTPG